MDATMAAAFATGVFGSGHCIAMCGGIAGALGGGIAPDLRRRPSAHFVRTLAFGVGRVVSYALVGALVGTLALAGTARLIEAQLALRLVAGVLLVGLGLHLAGVATRFASIEILGRALFQRVAPMARRLIPVRTVWHALALGALWGWVPCGMVYTALALSSTSAHPAGGALTMVAFGLGTLPSMLLTGAFAGQVSASLGRRWVRRLAGLAIVTFGVMGVVYSVTSLVRLGAHPAAIAECHGG